MLSYEKQLEFKSTVVEKAYKNYSGLGASDVSAVLPTMASPLQYGYRTKITPHFDAPPENRTRKGRPIAKKAKDSAWELKIGFEERGRPNTLDIEVRRADFLNETLIRGCRNVLLRPSVSMMLWVPRGKRSRSTTSRWS